MRKCLAMALGMSFLLAGCGQPQMPSGPPQKPAPPPELAKLRVFEGTWSGTSKIIVPKEEAGEKNADGGTMTWTLGGMFLKGEGWYEMGEGTRANYVEYWTWDPKAKMYRSWFFSDWGEFGEGSATVSADGKTFRGKFKGGDATGATMTGKSEMTFASDRTMTWKMTMSSSAMGTMEMKGTSNKEVKGTSNKP